MPTPQEPRLSVITPMRNESGNVAAMVREVGAACAPLGPFELIVVDDGSTDDTARIVKALQPQTPWLRLVRHRASCGQSAAILSGVKAARAPVCATLDGDLQNPPAELPRIAGPLLGESPPRIGLVAGQRVGRQASLSKRLASRAANMIRARILRDDTRDTGCGMKAFRRDVFLSLPYFDHLHRYLPALVRREGYEVLLVDVSDRARTEGVSNYTNLGRAIVGISDLMGVWWLLRRRKLPERMEDDQ